jgi:hypothetical protein
MDGIVLDPKYGFLSPRPAKLDDYVAIISDDPGSLAPGAEDQVSTLLREEVQAPFARWLRRRSVAALFCSSPTELQAVTTPNWSGTGPFSSTRNRVCWYSDFILYRADDLHFCLRLQLEPRFQLNHWF